MDYVQMSKDLIKKEDLLRSLEGMILATKDLPRKPDEQLKCPKFSAGFCAGLIAAITLSIWPDEMRDRAINGVIINLLETIIQNHGAAMGITAQTFSYGESPLTH